MHVRTPARSLPSSCLRAAAALALLAPGAFCQLDLPRRSGADAPTRPAPRGELAPYLVCDACGERNYTAPRSAPMGPGYFQANCAVCRTSRRHYDPKVVRGREELALPQPLAPEQAPAERAGSKPAPDVAVPSQGSAGGVQVVPPAARALLEALGAAGDDARHPLVTSTADALSELGEAGLAAARTALADARGAHVITGAIVLLRKGDAADAERVVERTRRALPRRVGPALLDEILRRDPVRGAPALLVEHLDHREFEMRASASRHLGRMAGAEVLPQLAQVLRSRRVDTRLRAVEVLASIDDPGAFDVLLEHLSDPSPQVASRITEALGRSDDPRAPLELLRRAFAARWILRDSAYALLALVDREDRTLEAVLDETHVETLLRGLSTREAFVAGASAVALAGIGFRSPDPTRSEWLDRLVPDQLVFAISGKEFHPDFSSLVPRVERRLRLVSGQQFGIDGPAWVAWWVENRDAFTARRAWLPLGEGDVDRLILRHSVLAEEPQEFVLLGPAAEVPAGPARGEVLRLSGSQVRALAQLLAREGAFDPTRLPGTRGVRERGTRALDLRIGRHGKSFEFGPRVSEPWFERLVSATLDLRQRNRWQRFPDLVRHPDFESFWSEESGWWALGEHSELERARRLKALVLAWTRRAERADRERGLVELESLYASAGVPAREDLPALLFLLHEEPYPNERVERLVALVLRAGRAAGEGLAPSIPVDLARELAAMLVQRFGQAARPSLDRVLDAAEPALVRALARADEALLREAAAATLGRLDADEDGPLLLSLLEDSDARVEAAAALALGRSRVEGARTALLVRARIGDPPVREAALRAIGELGGEYVLDALVLGLAERNPGLQEAAAAGLVALREPGTAPLFISLLAHGPQSPVYLHAVRGLEVLGDAARGELERVVRSPMHRSRRAATLLLGARLDPLAFEAALEQFTERPGDGELLFELAVLSCVDYRAADDPAVPYRTWWRDVDRRSPGLWLRTAMNRRGMDVPSPRVFEGELTAELAQALFALLERPEDFLVERGRRELSRALGEVLDPVPSGVAERLAWLADLRARVAVRTGSEAALPE